MRFDIQYEQEDDGRWLAEVTELPGVLVYGRTLDEALAKAQALALRVLADRLEHGGQRVGFAQDRFVERQAGVSGFEKR